MTKVTVFKVFGYEIKTPEGNFMDNCTFWVYADTSEEAVKKIKKFEVKKPFYQIVEVIEKYEDVTA